MSLLGSAFALALHATPLFVFPVFPSGPFGNFGMSVLSKEPATSSLDWRFGLGAGDALRDALNFAAEAHTPLVERIGLAGGLSAHIVKDYQNYFQPKLFSTGARLDNPEYASWATGFNAHISLRWQSHPNRSKSDELTGTGIFADLGLESEFYVLKINERSMKDKSAEYWSSQNNRLTSAVPNKIYCTAGILL